MQRQIIFMLCVLLASTGCTQEQGSGNESGSVNESNSPVSTGAVVPSKPNNDHWPVFVEKAKAALGTFNDITVWGEMHEGGWEPLTGKFIPVTVNDQVPAAYRHNMRSDRPMILPTTVESETGGDGQSNPYTIVGRMPGSNPEVQWTFLVRQYSIKAITDPKLDQSQDMAVIGHHPRTGATAYFQFFGYGKEKSSKVVVSPFSENGKDFWSTADEIAEFACQRCHSADPFIHTPWIDQARVDTISWEGYALPMVPSDPMGPFFFVDAGPGELFEPWNANLQHLDNPQNKCTTCHRVSPFSMLGLNSNATRYAGLTLSQQLKTPVASDGFQTDQYHKLPWMPPISDQDFYAGQKVQDATWNQDLLGSAAEINLLEHKYSLPMIEKTTPAYTPSPNVVPVPRPPQEYVSILVDRPNQDKLEPQQSLLILDTRMRANTDADLYQWQFVGKGPGNDNMLAAPVVYRRNPSDGSTVELEVIFVGEPQSQDSAGSWVFVKSDALHQVKQGDYFGLVLTNNGNEGGPALIPYTNDEWATIKASDGTTRYPFGNVTYFQASGNVPEEGDTVRFENTPAYRTYSFELKNRL